MKRYSCAMAAIALLATPLAALAQSAPTAPGTHTRTEASDLKNTGDVDAHIARLHSELQITPAEATQWTAFAQVMRENASAMHAAFMQRGQSLASMNAQQNLDSYAQIAQVQSSNMQKLASAFQTLYASFPPAQQKVADEVFRAQTARHAKKPG